jgi:hypothetical protein
MGEVVAGDLPREEDDHHVEGAEVAVELASGLDQGLPVLQVLVEAVLPQLLADVLQFRVEADQQLTELLYIRYLVTDVDQFLFSLFQDEEGEQDSVGIVGFDELYCDVESPCGFSMFF